MEFHHENSRQMVEEDRLSSLPDELIHKILSCLDMKFVVQTSVLSSRWEFLWRSIPCLNFSTWQFDEWSHTDIRTRSKFAQFVTHVLSHRNQQIEVSSVKLQFSGAANQVSVIKIAKYAFSHNLQQLTVTCTHYRGRSKFPPCLFSSQSLKHFTLRVEDCLSDRITLDTPLDFPSLTSMHLSNITLCGDLLTKCVNLETLTLQDFTVVSLDEVLDILFPRLSNLVLITSNIKVINLVAPQLQNLTVIDCSSIDYLNAPPGLVSLCLEGYDLPVQLSKDGFHSLNKATLCLHMSWLTKSHKDEFAPKFIKLLQEVCSARYLKLNVGIIECLSLFSDILSLHPSPFSNLISLTIDSGYRNNAYKVKMSTEVRNFFLENSPNAKFIIDLPEAQRKKAKRAAEIASHMTEFQALIKDHEIMAVKRKQAKEKAKAAHDKLMADVNAEVRKGHAESHRLISQFKISVEELRVLVKEEEAEVEAIISKEDLIRSLLGNLPGNERTEIETRYSRQLSEARQQRTLLLLETMNTKSIFAFEKLVSYFMITYQDVSGTKLPLASQMPASSSTTIPTTSTSGINTMP